MIPKLERYVIYGLTIAFLAPWVTGADLVLFTLMLLLAWLIVLQAGLEHYRRSVA